MCRFHTQTAGCSLTAQQPTNNVVRTALQALAAVLGGTNSLHTNSLDEALALPTREAARIALRTQQIIAHESGVTNTVDPLGGSHYVEALTDEMEEGARDYFRTIDSMGGMIEAIERGYPQREIQEASYAYQKAVERNEQIIVGVNEFTTSEENLIETLHISEEVRDHQIQRIRSLKSRRNGALVMRALAELKKEAEAGRNLMPPLIKAVREYATLGEMCDTLRDVFGAYSEPVF
jgi:methylmalonyl-CoA mutase N-terminal domain/subunit